MPGKIGLEINKQAIRKRDFLITKLNKYIPSLKLRKSLLQQAILVYKDKLTQQESLLNLTLKTYHHELDLFNSRLGKSMIQRAFFIPENYQEVHLAGVALNLMIGLEAPRLEASVLWDGVENEMWNLSVEIVTIVKTILSYKEVIWLLKQEWHKVSTRISLFEKQIIPKVKQEIHKIKNLLSDRFLGFIGQLMFVKRLHMQSQGNLEVQ